VILRRKRSANDLKNESYVLWDCRCVTESMVTDVSRQHSDVISRVERPGRME
jgi:hypothetical protein